MKVRFSFTNNRVGGKVTEVMEFEEDMTDEELDQLLGDWLWDRSQATWVKEDENTVSEE